MISLRLKTVLENTSTTGISDTIAVGIELVRVRIYWAVIKIILNAISILIDKWQCPLFICTYVTVRQWLIRARFAAPGPIPARSTESGVGLRTGAASLLSR